MIQKMTTHYSNDGTRFPTLTQASFNLTLNHKPLGISTTQAHTSVNKKTQEDLFSLFKEDPRSSVHKYFEAPCSHRVAVLSLSKATR